MAAGLSAPAVWSPKNKRAPFGALVSIDHLVSGCKFGPLQTGFGESWQLHRKHRLLLWIMPDQRQLLTESKPEISYTHIEAARPTKFYLRSNSLVKMSHANISSTESGVPPQPHSGTWHSRALAVQELMLPFQHRCQWNLLSRSPGPHICFHFKVLKLKAYSRAWAIQREKPSQSNGTGLP